MMAAHRSSTIVSAPGKIVLSGEYAVLDGVPAIAMAINRRASVRLKFDGGEHCLVSAPDFSPLVGQFDARTRPLQWAQGGTDYALVEAVWNRLVGPLPAACSMRLDTRSFIDPDSGSKLGLGSSAALCVALALGLQKDAAVADLAFESHRDFQQGSGSGVDVACSLRGGLLSYQMGDRKTRALAWPEGLYYRVLWSGIAADTRSKITRLTTGSNRIKASRRRLAAVSSDVAKCWQAADIESLFAAYEEFVHALWEFDVDHTLGIFDGGHVSLLEAARASGLCYKPCGAGGGDVGILLSHDEEKLARFVAGQIGSFTALDCALDSRGAVFERDVESDNG